MQDDEKVSNTCNGCNRLMDEGHIVTLVTGEKVCNYCPRWINECEAKSVLRMPLSDRRNYLSKIEAKRGNIDELKRVIKLVFEHNKKNEIKT